MTEVVVIDSDSDDDSIEEIEPPRKPSPTVIDIDDSEIVLNVNENVPTTLAARDVFKEENAAEPAESIENPTHWTTDMIKFYNDDWGDEEQFVVEKIQEKMDKHPSLWCTSGKRSNRYWERFASMSHRSRRKNHPLVCAYEGQRCHMCGEPGHSDRHCPRSLCLNCGNQMMKFVTMCHKCSSESMVQCSRCSLYGHHYINCTDNWRRYHMTTGTTDINVPHEPLYKSARDMWCCNCGRRGHHHVDCKQRKSMGHISDTFPFVTSYETSFVKSSVERSFRGRPTGRQTGRQTGTKSERTLRRSKNKRYNLRKRLREVPLREFTSGKKEKYLKFLAWNGPKQNKKRKKKKKRNSPAIEL